MLINTLMIIFIVSFTIDISGIVNSISEFLYKLTHKNIKYNGWTLPLLNCSLCVTFWTVLLFTLISHTLIISLFTSCLSAYLVQFVTLLFYKIRDLIINIINLIKT